MALRLCAHEDIEAGVMKGIARTGLPYCKLDR
jgi:hypothetical protein